MSGKVDHLREALTGIKGGVAAVILLSTLLNVLLLAGSMYMMLVYDSVLPSHSIPTLFGLFIMVIVVYGFQAAFEIFRSKILADMAAGFTTVVSPRVQHAIAFMSLRNLAASGGDGLTPIRDLDTIRQFLSGPGPSALIDMPWVLFFLVILSCLHPWLGAATLAGVLVMLALAYIADRSCRGPTQIVNGLSGNRFAMADETRRHVELVQAMGMERRLEARWSSLNGELIQAQDSLASSASLLGGISRAFRLFLQSFVLTVGALLVIDGSATGGIIFASSMMSARALAPIDMVIGQWKAFAAMRLSWDRLNRILSAMPANKAVELSLPPPSASLSVENLVVVAPGTQHVTVGGISFSLSAGEALGIIGPSAAGKSSLVRALLGLWLPVRGSVRLDGAELSQWSSDALGQHVGYLPQSVELMSGSIAENIARFAVPIDSEAVVHAARAAGVHEMIVQMADGYGTQVGLDGTQLSAGQRQRIALARALYGDPFFVVLDEPNSNLDSVGEAALVNAIQGVRERNGICIIVAHRPAAIAHVSHVMILRDGRIEAFGPREEVLARFKQPPPAAADDNPSIGTANVRQVGQA